jgi:V8-like Glu-specific endopeptidase
MWPMQGKRMHSIASPMAKKDITQGTAPDNKEREEQEQKLISLTSTRKKIQHTKEAKWRAAEWP